MSEETFDALLEAYQERGKRVVELERLCRDMYLSASLQLDKEGFDFGSLQIHYHGGDWRSFIERMEELGLLEEE